LGKKLLVITNIWKLQTQKVFKHWPQGINMFLLLYSGDILIACTFLLETSTPFVALRTILSDLQLNNSVLYLLNGLLMLVVFFLCRIVIYPFFYYLYAVSAGMP
jgi:hypothetical protein